jgi:hypothetical protein
MNKSGSRFNGWHTVRYELLNTRICDLGIRVEKSPFEPFVTQLYRELEVKRLKFHPSVYLSDSWGCPDQVPVIGVPFYLADERLARIEEEQTGDVEDPQTIMMLLRHETAHAFNYAYRLWEDSEWVEAFGPFTKPYRDTFHPQPRSRNFVRHISASQYGPTYAQKHSDEDFAETFAVWLTPGSNWRRTYQKWPAMKKLKYVDRTMRRVGALAPVRTEGELYNPVGKLTMLLAEHYGEHPERFRAAARGYVDDRLREVFSAPKRGDTMPLGTLLKTHRRVLTSRMVRLAGLGSEDAAEILRKLEERADALKLRVPSAGRESALVDLASVAIALAMDFAYTGQFLD